MVTITLKDNGADRYTMEMDTCILGRRYDNEAEQIVIAKPESEVQSVCTLIASVGDKVVDNIIVGDEPIMVTSNLSQFETVRIGFAFTRLDGYIKSSEVKQFAFLPALKPYGFVPVEPEKKQQLEQLLEFGFAKTELDGKSLKFYNLGNAVVSSVDLGAFLNLDDIADNLTTDDSTKVLSAKQGVVIKGELDRLDSEKANKSDTYDKQTIDDAIDDLDRDYTDLNQRTTDLEDEVETNTADIQTNRNLIVELQAGGGNTIAIKIDPATFVLTVELKNKAGETISSGSVDLPLETMVVSASYKDGTLTLTLQNGQTLDIDISSIVSGLVNQQTFDDEVTRLDGEITTLQGTQTAQELTITAIEEANKDRDIKINALEKKSSEHEQDLATMETDFAALKKNGEFENITQSGNPVYGILQGTTAPETTTAGQIGQFYLDTVEKKLYQCVAINTTTIDDTETNEYEWQAVGGGSSKYMHNIYIWNTQSSQFIRTILITETDEQYNPTAIATKLYELGFDSSSTAAIASGMDSINKRIYLGIYGDNQGRINVVYTSYNLENETITIDNTDYSFGKSLSMINSGHAILSTSGVYDIVIPL